MGLAHLYIHVPFCARRCSYCDFAIAVRRAVPVDDYLVALAREIDLRLAARPDSPLATVYLGGGTPSRLGGTGVRRVLDLVRQRFTILPDAEVTIEANPEDVSAEIASTWRTAGVTRVSLGIQSFNDDVLRWMHRTHDAARAVSAAAVLREAGFEDWSLDLIFALPPELGRSWPEDLERAILLEPAHISCYGLTVEPHTPLLRWQERGQVREAGDERYEAEFLETHRRLADAGYEHYEVSNYARPGHRALHNSAYWKRVPYLGLGPSAHSFDGTNRSWNEREYAAWHRRLMLGQDPIAGMESISDQSVIMEEAYLGLRSSTGIAITEANTGDFDRWRDQGWAVVGGGMGRLTPEGWLRLDALVSDLTEVRSR